MPSSTHLNNVSNLSVLPLFDTLDPAQLERLQQKVRIEHIAKNEYLFKPGDTCEHLYLLLKGYLKNGIFVSGDKEQMQYLIRPLEFVGTDHLIGYAKRRQYAKVLSQQATVLVVPVDTVYHLMRENERFSMNLLGMVANMLKRSEMLLNLLLTADVRSRIIHILREYSVSINSQAPLEALIHEGLTQHEIAQMVGATRQTVAAVLNDLRKNKLIEFNRRKIVFKSDLT